MLVECDDSASASRAATHLVDRVRVPVILGAGASGTTLTVAQEVTIPKGVLLFAPSATSPALTTLQDNGLVWRSAPSDALQAVALVDAMESMEARYRAENAVAPATATRCRT